jgi:hypothetical protein
MHINTPKSCRKHALDRILSYGAVCDSHQDAEGVSVVGRARAQDILAEKELWGMLARHAMELRS